MNELDFIEFHRNFCGKILEVNGGPGETIRKLKEILEEIAPRAEIARIQSAVYARKELARNDGTVQGLECLAEPIELYSGADYDADRPVTVKRMVKYDVESVFRAWPVEGTSWNDLQTEDIRQLLGLLQMTLDRSQQMELAEKGKYTDPLTQIPNTVGFRRRGDELIREYGATSYTAFYFNIQNFKFVNEECGYGSGDRLLSNFARMLTSYLLEDEVCGRFGGDLFATLVKNERADDFAAMIRKLRMEIETEKGRTGFTLYTVAGAYRLGEKVQSMDMVIMGITSAYHIAKEQTHQSIVYCTEEMFLGLMKEQGFLLHFPEYLEAGEFLAYYQPKIRLSDNVLVGAEALVRWRHDGKLVPPGDFIPALEKKGNVCRLDFYILERVCQKIREWLDEGIEVPVISSNFSRWHLKNPRFVDDILEVLDRYEVPHELCEVEFTETAGCGDEDTISRVVEDLRQHGVYMAIDDFGTGYSSMNMLKEISVNVLKLDRSLLNTASKPNVLLRSDEIMMRHIVSLARDMGVTSLAEGVETREQRDFLRSIGCEYAQGFYYDRPLDEEAFRERMIAGKYDI